MNKRPGEQDDDPATRDGGPSDAQWQVLLLRLSAFLRSLEGETEILDACAEALGQFLDLDRVGFASLDESSQHCTSLAEWCADSKPASFEGLPDLDAFGPPVAERPHAERKLVWSDAEREIGRYGEDMVSRYRAAGLGAVLTIPIVREGTGTVFLHAHQGHGRTWTFGQVLLAREIAERAWANIERMRAGVEVSRVSERLRVALEDGHLDVQSRMAIRESEERFRLIVENTLGYAIFTTDRDGIIDSWPPAAAAVLGWSEQEAIGKSADILFVPEDRANDVPRAEFTTALRKGYAPDVRWHQHKDGSRVFIEGSVWPLRGERGELKGFLKIGHDVTQRRKDELAIRASEERFRVLATSVPHLVFRSTSKGERTWASPQWAEYTGLSDEDSYGYGWLDAIHPADRNVALEKWDEAGGGETYYGEHRIFRRSDGTYRWHQTRAVRLPSTSDAQEEWVGSAADVHDMRMMQERLGVLVAELQHRTRNLLGIIRGIVAETVPEDALEEFQPSFNMRLSALSRVQGLLSREGGQPVSMRELVMLELEALGADWGQVELEGPEIPLSEVNLQTLALALHELSTNAFKYGALAHGEGRLAVSWGTIGEGANARLSIRWFERFGTPKPLIDQVSSGFGRQLIEEALPYQLGAETRFELGADVLECTIEIPLSKGQRRR